MKTANFIRDNAPWLGAGALLTLMSSFGQTFFISIFAGEIRSTFALSHGDWGTIYSLGTGLSALTMVWLGALTDRYRVKSLGAWVMVGLALACLAMAFNPFGGALFLVIYALRLFGQGMASHVAVVAMARWFVATRGRALAVATLGFTVGELMLPISFVAALRVVDWHLLWIVAAGITLASIPVLRWLLQAERTPQSMADQQDQAGLCGQHWTRAEVLSHPLFWFMVPALLGPAAFNTAFFFHQVHYADLSGLSHLALVALFPVYTALSVLAMVASGWALDRFGTAQLIGFFQIPMVAAFLVFAWFGSVPGILFGLVLMSLTTGANSTLPNAFWAELYGTRHLGSIKAMAAAIMVLGSAFGPGVTGILIDHGVGLLTQFVWIAAYFALATVSMLVGIYRARRK